MLVGRFLTSCFTLPLIYAEWKAWTFLRFAGGPSFSSEGY